MRWLDRYMALTFKDKGRDFSGVDCLGLHLLIVTHEAKVAMQNVDVTFSAPKDAMRKVESELCSGRWIKIAEGDGAAVKDRAAKFDAIAMTAHIRCGMTVRNEELHIGTAVGDGMMVHIEKGCGVQFVAMDDPDVRHRIKAVYRHRALCT